MSRAAFAQALIISSVAMLTGISMLLAFEALNIAKPAWTRCAALLTLGGASAELAAVWRYIRQR